MKADKRENDAYLDLQLKSAIKNRENIPEDAIIAYIKWLESEGAEINQYNHREDKTILNVAVRHGSKEVVQSILSRNLKDINTRDSGGKTPLIIAAFYGRESEVVQLLVSAGAEINSKDFTMQSALHVAIANRFLVDSQDADAAKFNRRRIAEFLVEAGADVNQADTYGQTPFMLAASYDDVEILEKMLTCSKVNIEQAAFGGKRAIHFAIISNSNQALKFLINYAGCDVNAIGMWDKPSLALALMTKNIEAAKIILASKSVDVNAAGFDGKTAIFYAKENGYEEIFQTLINAGADINIKNSQVLTANEFAAKNNNFERDSKLITDQARNSLDSCDLYESLLLDLSELLSETSSSNSTSNSPIESSDESDLQDLKISRPKPITETRQQSFYSSLINKLHF